MPMRTRLSPRIVFGLVVVLAAGALPRPASAQPMGGFLTFEGFGEQFVAVPGGGALNPIHQLTVEVTTLSSGRESGCETYVAREDRTLSIAWCDGRLRTILRSTGSTFEGGGLPPYQPHHIAVTFDGTTLRHYVDGELVLVREAPGLLERSDARLLFGSNSAIGTAPPFGSIDEVRIWNVARTQAQIRGAINRELGPTPGLVGLWHFNGDTRDSSGGHHDGGPPKGGAVLSAHLPLPPGPCFADPITACFESGRFEVRGSWTTYTPPAPNGEVSRIALGWISVVPGASDTSALFWFFSPDNWELLVKSVNGCGLNDRRWVFSAATTNLHYRLTVFDRLTGDQRVYWSFSGPPAAAVTDTSAFASCP